MLFHVEEVGTFQVRVASLEVGIEALGLDRGRNLAHRDIVLVEHDLPLHVVEAAVGHGVAEVGDGEANIHVAGIDPQRDGLGMGSRRHDCNGGEGDGKSSEH